MNRHSPRMASHHVVTMQARATARLRLTRSESNRSTITSRSCLRLLLDLITYSIRYYLFHPTLDRSPIVALHTGMIRPRWFGIPPGHQGGTEPGMPEYNPQSGVEFTMSIGSKTDSGCDVQARLHSRATSSRS